jgi:hypothetical protein
MKVTACGDVVLAHFARASEAVEVTSRGSDSTLASQDPLWFVSRLESVVCVLSWLWDRYGAFPDPPGLPEPFTGCVHILIEAVRRNYHLHPFSECDILRFHMLWAHCTTWQMRGALARRLTCADDGMHVPMLRCLCESCRPCPFGNAV